MVDNNKNTDNEHVKINNHLPVTADGNTKLRERLEQCYNKLMFSEESGRRPYHVCLAPLLTALNYGGDERQINQALPHFTDVTNMALFRNVLLNLGYETTSYKGKIRNLKEQQFPCVFELENGPFVCLAVAGDGSLEGFDAEGRSHLSRQEAKQATSVILINDREAEQVNSRTGWFQNQLWGMRRSLVALFFLSLFVNVLMLATPLYTMNVYNHVVTTKSLSTLSFFFLAVLVTVGAEVYCRRIRGNILAYIGARMDSAIHIGAFKKVLQLPLIMTENSNIHRQLTQFRQFSQIKEFIASNLSSAFLDLPFIVIFLTLLGIISGTLALIPIILIVVLTVISLIMKPLARRTSIESGHQMENYNALSLELSSKLETIRHVGAESFWADRQGKAAVKAARASFTSRFVDISLQNISSALMMATGIVTIAYGAYFVIEGEMSHGALIAIMMIIWRVLAPVQMTILSAHRLGQIYRSIKQLNNLMAMKEERRVKNSIYGLRKFEGDLRMENVGYRYRDQVEPAVRGVNLEIKKGEIVALVGPSGAGKSTLLKLLIGLYRPVSGHVALDGCNLTQLDTGEVRFAMSYLTPRPMVIYGTIAQNIRAANPLATDEEVLEALRAAGIDENDPLMADGLNTRIRNEDYSLTAADRARLSLAAAFGADGAVLLLDEPATYLSDESQKTMLKSIEKLKGQKTVVMVTSRLSELKICDRLIFMQKGTVVGEMTPDEYFEKIKQAEKQSSAVQAS